MDPQILRQCAAAYYAVYDQNIREGLEDQKDFELWVDSLVKEGYDLSDCTWEEVYEAYIEEARAEGVKPYKPGVKPMAFSQSKPLSGEKGDGSGYGADKKFTQDTDAKSFRPGVDVPKVKKFGRISRIIPHGIGDHANRVQSRVSTIVGKDPGAPKSEKLPPQEKKKLSREIVRKEQVDVYDFILSHLLDEGYASTPEAATSIMANMSEEWIQSILG